MNKKGSTLDNIWVLVSLFGLAFFFITMTMFWNVLDSQATELWTGSVKGAEIQTNADNAVAQFDFIFLIVWVGLHLGILVTAFLLRTHPVVYIVAIFITAILALLAAPLSNAYGEVILETDISAAANDMPIQNFIMQQLPKLEVIWCFITAIVMFGLSRSEGFI